MIVTSLEPFNVRCNSLSLLLFLSALINASITASSREFSFKESFSNDEAGLKKTAVKDTHPAEVTSSFLLRFRSLSLTLEMRAIVIK
jgi:hypothetical protein